MSGRNEHKEKILKQLQKNLIGKPKLIKDYYYKLTYEKEAQTCSTYIRKVLNFADFLNVENAKFKKRVAEVKESEIIQYLLRISTKENGEETSDSWKAVNWTALYGFFSFLVKEGIREDNPMEGIKRPSIKDPIKQVHMEPEETRRVLKNVENRESVTERAKKKSEKWKERDNAIFRIFLVTGIRLSALTELDVDEYDEEKRLLRITDKRRKYREVVLDQESGEIMSAWIEKRKELLKHYKDPKALFISERRKRISQTGVRYIIEKYTSILDKNITPHKLRSTYGVMIYEQTKDINKVQELMAHRQIATTQRYLAGMQSDPEEAANIVSGVLKKV